MKKTVTLFHRTLLLSSSDHDDLVRCSICRLKYTRSEVTTNKEIGKYTCKFCSIEAQRMPIVATLMKLVKHDN